MKSKKMVMKESAPKVDLENDPCVGKGDIDIPRISCPHEPSEWINMPKCMTTCIDWVIQEALNVNSQII